MRKLFIAAAIVFVFVFVFVGAAVYWRLPLAQAALRYGLETAGIDGARFTVTHATFSRLVLTDIAIGKELRVKEADIAFDAAHLFTRPVAKLSLRGVMADAAGLLPRRLMTSGGSSEPLSDEKIGAIIRVLPAVVMHDGAFRVTVKGYDLTMSGSLKAGWDDKSGYAGVLDLHAIEAKPNDAQTSEALVLPKFAARSAFAVRRDMASFDASLSAAGNLAMAASGRYRFKAGTGQADIDLKSLRFGPMFMSFMRLVPNAAAVDLRAGTASGKARLSWNGRDVGGTATVAVKGLEMSDETTGTEIEGLNAQIHLDRLMPAQTPPGQILRIRRIAAGTDLTALTLRFSLESTPASVYPRLRIEGFDAGFIGGRLSVRPTVLDPVSGENRVAIDLTDVNLTALFALIGVEGVSGEGRLGGVIPVRQVGAAVDISGGRLAAAGPGTLRIRSAAVKRALAQGGKEVALMLSALEDFRYDSLTIDIDKKPQGDGRIRLKTDGHNPAVLDGRSFRININISGNVDRIAAVVAHALKLPAAVVRSIVPKAK